MPETSMQPGTARPKTDRRAHPRQKIQSLTYVELGGGNGGIALNVSEGGMTVVAAQPLDADGAIDIALQLPQTRKRLALKGEIRWMSDSHKEAGIRFLELTEEQLDDIRGWMSREASPQPMEYIAAVPSLHESYRRDIPATAFEDDEEELQEQDAASIPEPEPQPQLSAPPRKIERVFEAGHQEAGHREEDLRAASDQLHGRESSAVLKEPQVDDVPPAPIVEPRTVPSAAPRAGRAARTPFTTLASDSPVTPPADTLARHEIVERVVETVAALNSATSTVRTAPAPLGLGLTGPHLPENPRPALGASYRAAETIDDGSKDFRIHLQSGWVLALLVLLLALISFVAGMAVRRGALNRVLGEGEAAAGAHGGAIPSATTQSGAATPQQNAAGALRQIEIIDASNRRWEIPAAPGGVITPAPIPNAAAAAGAAPLSSAAASNGTPASNSSTTQSGADLEDATTTNTADGGLLLSLPEAPVTASSLVAITARRSIPVPAELASKPRNLQVGSLANLVEPVYPVDALQQNVEGTVKLRGTISADGSMKSLDVENGPKLLLTPSLTALRLWRYNPTMLNGKAIETEEEITVVYRLPR